MFMNDKIKNTDKELPKGVEVVVSAVITNKEGKILLVKSPKWANKWMMPGGHIEPGETMAAAAKREIQEEVGIEIEPKSILLFQELINSKDFYRPAHFIYFVFLCEMKDGDNVVLDNSELNGYIWVKPEEGLKMELAESFSETINKYIGHGSNFC